jgi:hypothetical protein
VKRLSTPWLSTLAIILLVTVLGLITVLVPWFVCPSCLGFARKAEQVGGWISQPGSEILLETGCPTCRDRGRVALLTRRVAVRPDPVLLDLVLNSSDLRKSSDPTVNQSRTNTFFSSLQNLLLRAGTKDAKVITEDLKRQLLTGHALYVIHAKGKHAWSSRSRSSQAAVRARSATLPVPDPIENASPWATNGFPDRARISLNVAWYRFRTSAPASRRHSVSGLTS